MAELISIPLKKPSDVDLIKPLNNLLQSTYSTADKPEDFKEALSELSKLRSNAIWKAYEKYESSLDVIYCYYDQLVSLEGKIPPEEVQIPFKWKDAFDKGSIFGGRISLTISSLSYEKVCILFNIAALQSSVASAQSLENDDGLKLAAKLFQQAAGIFNHLKGIVMAAIQQDPTPDLNPETLGALSSLMLAQAQEIFVTKAIHDSMKDGIIAKLSSQCEELYAEVLKIFQRDNLRTLWEREWIPLIAGKQGAYHAMAEFYQSLVCKNNKNIGEEIGRLELSLELFKIAQQRSGRQSFFQDFINKVQRNLTEARKDNDFIYHERILDAKNLDPIGRAMLAKSLPIPEKMSQNFNDLFHELVPVTVHQALAAYDVRKNEIVNTEIMKLRESTQLLNSVLASLNLPAAIEATEGDSLPRSLLDKAESMKQLGGIMTLQSLISELPNALQRNRDILDEADRLLREEKQSDDTLRAQFKERWNRTPSEKLTETFCSNITKYRSLIDNAIQADKLVSQEYNKHREGMELLSKPLEDIQAAVPQSSRTAITETSAVNTLRRLMEEVEKMKADRDLIETELKSTTVDMKSKFMNALIQDGAVSEPTMSVTTLGEVFGPLQKQVRESIDKQEKLVADIQTANSEFVRESGIGANSYDTKMKELASAYDAFCDLQNNLKEGTKFYNDLTELLISFQNKISDYCFARKTEKEELLKDLTQESSRQIVGPTPTPPAHHTPDDKKSPPARPPPPTVTNPQAPAAGSLPYPTYAQNMPVPYGASGTAPYPTYVPPPMPQGYNPYATMPYPGNYNYPGGFPQAPPGGYAMFPPTTGYPLPPPGSYPQQQPPPGW